MIEDPTRRRMLQHLSQVYDLTEYADDAEIAMYWFANDYHGGQWSELYGVLCNSPYKPGVMTCSVKQEDALAGLMYSELEIEFAKRTSRLTSG
jgi:hypothetical protein